MTDLSPLIDTHIHFWDTQHPALRYAWLAPGAEHPILGDIEAIKSVRYDATAFHAEVRFAGVTGAVHVQAAVDTPDPVEETRWLDTMADHAEIPFVIVAGVDLSSEDVIDRLDAHQEASGRLRGVRDYGRDGYLADPAFRRGVGLLEPRGLLLDLDCAWQEMPIALELARSVPGVPIVLEHIGYPRDTVDPEYYRSWRDGIATLAAAPNVYCKISGLGMNRAGWTVDGIRPWVADCIEQFTPQRCLWGSNWPVDRLYASYDAYAEAFRELISGYTATEQHSMLSGVADRLYRVSESAS